jgi:hypothetical protein
MKHFVIGLLFVSWLPASGFAAFGLPWFHTRPKPVVFEQQSEEEIPTVRHTTSATNSPVRRVNLVNASDQTFNRAAPKTKPVKSSGAHAPVTPGTAR